MRIVHVYNQLDPSNGGPPHVIVGLTAGQQALGHEVVLISEDPATSPTLDAFLADHLDPVPKRYAVHPRLFRPSRTHADFKAAPISCTPTEFGPRRRCWPLGSAES